MGAVEKAAGSAATRLRSRRFASVLAVCGSVATALACARNKVLFDETLKLCSFAKALHAFAFFLIVGVPCAAAGGATLPAALLRVLTVAESVFFASHNFSYAQLVKVKCGA